MEARFLKVRQRCLDGSAIYCSYTHLVVFASQNQDKLQGLIQKECFLDSDDLRDLRQLLVSVQNSDVLVILQSSDVLSRPWCLLEMVAAIDAGVPIVAINVQGKVGVPATTTGFL